MEMRKRVKMQVRNDKIRDADYRTAGIYNKRKFYLWVDASEENYDLLNQSVFQYHLKTIFQKVIQKSKEQTENGRWVHLKAER